MLSVSFWTSGPPQPAGSKNAFCLRKGGQLTGRAVVVDTSGKKGKTWRADLRDACSTAYDGPALPGPLQLSVTFHMQRPQAHYIAGKPELGLRPDAPHYHSIKPDATKLLRAVEDALTGFLWADDCEIAVQSVQKIYTNGNPGVLLSVGPAIA